MNLPRSYKKLLAKAPGQNRLAIPNRVTAGLPEEASISGGLFAVAKKKAERSKPEAGGLGSKRFDGSYGYAGNG
jgi:hypothetical protein